ncbi:transporter substrate-binding domain-containing protein [Chryseobacterium sp. MIQD13]|uniref:transporter substrate-binding domain-containing protein n=1 Tax=Chryseobacterium sp. MIQD13 TaxID=3422310 RepID=UPI003D2D14DF
MSRRLLAVIILLLNFKVMQAQDFQSKPLDKHTKIKIAYVDEPPFYWTEDSSVEGADIELAEAILHAIGITDIEYIHTTFENLLPGVQAGKWDMNVPIFVTSEREKTVAFSTPVWALVDGFVVLKGNPKNLTSYEAVGKRADVRLGLIPGQVQFEKAKAAGVNDSQIIMFKDQPEVIAALLEGKIDAFAATAIGNNSIAKANPQLESIPHQITDKEEIPVGAFSFNKESIALINAVNEQLCVYLGTEDHRTKMAKYGIIDTEIDPVVNKKY